MLKALGTFRIYFYFPFLIKLPGDKCFKVYKNASNNKFVFFLYYTHYPDFLRFTILYNFRVSTKSWSAIYPNLTKPHLTYPSLNLKNMWLKGK